MPRHYSGTTLGRRRPTLPGLATVVDGLGGALHPRQVASRSQAPAGSRRPCRVTHRATIAGNFEFKRAPLCGRRATVADSATRPRPRPFILEKRRVLSLCCSLRACKRELSRTMRRVRCGIRSP
eukprot:357440-Chlamydomonas_euryale.AAC.1